MVEDTDKYNAFCINRILYSVLREDFTKALEQNGYVVVRGFTNLRTLVQAQKEVQAWLVIGEPGSTVGGQIFGHYPNYMVELTSEQPSMVKREHARDSCGRSPMVREKFFTDPLYQDVVEHFIGIGIKDWTADIPEHNVRDPVQETKTYPKVIQIVSKAERVEYELDKLEASSRRLP